MKCVLGLLFYYKRYKKKCTMRVYSNNTMLEEISLEEDIVPVHKRFINDKGKDELRPLPKKLFLIELNADQIKNDITIECDNNDNNWTNGFMSNFSYIEFDAIFLLPKNFFQNNTAEIIFSRPTKDKHVRIWTLSDTESKVWPLAFNGVELYTNGQKQKVPETLYGTKLGGKILIKMPITKKHNTVIFSDPKNAWGQFKFWCKIEYIFQYFNLLNRCNESK